ncbi:MAG: hypothetical protein ACRDP7_47095 [Trebonia sp.]
MTSIWSVRRGGAHLGVFTEIGEARRVLRENRRSAGNMAALVSAP